MASQYPYSDYTIKWATSQWEIDQAMALRRRVFCQEQGIFEHNDSDHIDGYAQCLYVFTMKAIMFGGGLA